MFVLDRMQISLLLTLLLASATYSLADSPCRSGYRTIDSKICYKIFPDLKIRADAAAQCMTDGGTLASIPNGFTNAYIYSLAANTSSSLILLGIKCSNGDRNTCVNDDGSTIGPYYNFAPGSPSTMGNCIYMSTKGLSSQQWMSFDCSADFNYVCEIAYGSIAPTVSPSTCGSSVMYHNDSSGTIYSPGYPNGYLGTRCSYELEVHGSAEIKIEELNLGPGSTLQLYNYMVAEHPFAILGSWSPVNSSFLGPFQTKIVFNSPQAYSGRWKLSFSTVHPQMTDCHYAANVNNICYQVGISSEAQTFNQQAADCRITPGATLSLFTSQQLGKELMPHLKQGSDLAAFGLRCPNVRYAGDISSCRWEDGTSLEYNGFKKGYPRESGCCVIRKQEWYDCISCDSYQIKDYYCQMPIYGTGYSTKLLRLS